MTTTTTERGIKCAHCKAYHPGVEDVRKCAMGGSAPTVVSDAAIAKATATAPSNHKPASEKQVAFVLRLDAERDVPVAGKTEQEATHIARLEDLQGGGKFVSSREASALIEWLLTIPKAAPAQHPEAQAAAKAEPLTHGMYRKDETIYKIQKAVHGSGHLYAKRLVPGDGYGAKASFVYAPGAMKVLTLADRMSLEEAKAWGALYGTCCVCGRTLTNEDSIEAGIGPVCAGKF